MLDAAHGAAWQSAPGSFRKTGRNGVGAEDVLPMDGTLTNMLVRFIRHPIWKDVIWPSVWMEMVTVFSWSINMVPSMEMTFSGS